LTKARFLVFRAALIATLIAAQGVPSLACGLTLCLHDDGGFCVELSNNGCCGHHDQCAAADDGCGGHEHSANTEHPHTIGTPPCDCTHLALPDQAQMADRLRREVPIASQFAGDLAVAFHTSVPVCLPAAALSAPAKAAGEQSAALSFLEPVMLRC
jgi:hypothetical protein